jgi:hypothetical protein
LGLEKLARAGTEKYSVGIARIIGEASDVAALGANQLPRTRKHRCRNDEKDAKNQKSEERFPHSCRQKLRALTHNTAG